MVAGKLTHILELLGDAPLIMYENWGYEYFCPKSDPRCVIALIYIERESLGKRVHTLLTLSCCSFKGGHVRPHSSEEDSSSESLENDDLVTLPHPLARKSAPEPLLTASTSNPLQKLSDIRKSDRTRVDRMSKVKPDARPKKPAQFVDSSSSEESSNPSLPLPEGGPFPAPPAIISDPLGVDSVHVDPLGLVHQDGLLGERRRSDSESSSSLEGADGGLGGTEVVFHALPEIPGIDVGSAHLKEIEKVY